LVGDELVELRRDAIVHDDALELGLVVRAVNGNAPVGRGEQVIQANTVAQER